MTSTEYFGPVTEVIESGKWYKPSKVVFSCASCGKKVNRAFNQNLTLVGSLCIFAGAFILSYVENELKHSTLILGALAVSAIVSYIAAIKLVNYEKPNN